MLVFVVMRIVRCCPTPLGMLTGKLEKRRRRLVGWVTFDEEAVEGCEVARRIDERHGRVASTIRRAAVQLIVDARIGNSTDMEEVKLCETGKVG
jgi:hypothetical protein